MHKLEGRVGPEGHLDYAMQHINDKPCAIYPMVYNMQQGIYCINKCPFCFLSIWFYLGNTIMHMVSVNTSYKIKYLTR